MNYSVIEDYLERYTNYRIMAKVELAKCPHCGGDLKNTKISKRKDEKVFVCRNCMEILGVVKE